MTDVPYDKNELTAPNGAPKTQGLFYEYEYNPDALFTIHEDDITKRGKTFYSLRKLYMEAKDLTGYRFAEKYLAGYRQWKRFKANKWINDHIENWEEELELSIRADALQDMLNLSETEGSFQATKFLLDRGYSKLPKGRPSKKDQVAAGKKDAQAQKEYEQDMLRLVKK